MPQPKQTWLDRLFGATRRKAVPPVKLVATPEPVEPTSGTKPTQHRDEQVLPKEPQASPPPILDRQPEFPPEVAAGMQRTSTEVAALQSAALQQALSAERAFHYGRAEQQQQQANYTQMFGQMEQIAGTSSPLFGGDPDPRQFLPHWKRHYGDLGKGFLPGGGGK